MFMSRVPDYGKRNESLGSTSEVDLYPRCSILIVFVPMKRNESLGSTSAVLD